MTVRVVEDPDVGGEGRSLFEVLHGFLVAQRLDLYPPRELAPGVTAIQADDDGPLVNSYIAYEPQPDAAPPDLDVLLHEARADPARTEIVVPDDLAGQVRHVRTLVRGLVRQVLPLSECLDGFLRPASICYELTGENPGDAESRIARRRSGPPMFDPALLNDKDWIRTQAAIVPGHGMVNAQLYLNNSWAQGSSPRLCIVIAPAGHGKSKITHILARRLAERYQVADYGHRPPLPILIPFGKYPRGTSSFDGLVLRFMDAFGVARLTAEAFRYLISLGRILFILDGYDEMVEASPDVAAENIAEFVRQAGPQSRILLTSRSTFYRTSSDVVGQIGDPLLPEDQVEVIDLQPFDEDQAKEYVAKRLGNTPDRTQAMERAQRIIRADWNPEILGSPIFLAEFVNLIAGGQWSAPDVRRIGFLEYLIGRTFERERERQQHEFSDEQQRQYLESIAFDLLTTDVAGYQRDDLEIFALEVAGDEALQPSWSTLWPRLASHYFLLPDEDAANLPVATMRHQVWRDYFQGSALAGQHNAGSERALSAMSARDLPEGVLRAADIFINREAWASLAGRLDRSGDKLLRNMLRMALLRRKTDQSEPLELPSEIGSRLAGRDLSEIVFRNLSFDGSFAGSDLTGCFFERCELSGTSFAGTKLNRTVFSNCSLPASEFADADIASVTINGKAFFGPQLAASRAEAEAKGEAQAAGAAEAASEVREWAMEVLRARLGKFTVARGGEANAGLDMSISWTAFMGGTNPRDRDFVVRRLYRALHAEKVVFDAPTGSERRPTLRLGSDSATRNEVLAFVRDGEIGSTIERVIARLVK